MTSPPQESKLRGEPEAERELIARVMYGRLGIIPEPPKLAPSRFVVVPHQLIWAAILDLNRKGLPYDVISVTARLRETGQLKAAGAHYLAAMETHVGTADSLDHYVTLIQRAAAARAFGPLGRQISELALDAGEGETGAVRARYQTLVRRADSVCDYASRNGHTPVLTVRTPYEILTTPAPALNWIYEPWLGAGDICVLAGEPGLGKSWLALDLMFCLVLGRPWATVAPAAGNRCVLYVDEENNFRLVRHRIGKLVDGLDIGMADLDPARLGAHYAMEQGINLDDPTSLDLLKRKLDQIRPDIVLFDSLVRIHRRDENNNAQMAELIGGIIKPLARNVGAGAIIIHHLGKSTKDRPEGRIAERIRGASDIRGVADQVWGLERIDDGLLMTHIKCRYDRESSPVVVSLDDVHLCNGVRITYTAEDLDASSIIKEAIALAGQDGINPAALINILDQAAFKQSKRLVSRHTGNLHRAGVIRKRKSGRQVRFWLSDYAPSDAE